MRMPGHADDPIEQIPTAAGEVVFEDLVAFAAARWAMVIPCQARGLHQLLVSVEVFSIHISPPRLIAGKIVEVISPFAELHRIENAPLVERGQGGFVLMSQSAT